MLHQIKAESIVEDSALMDPLFEDAMNGWNEAHKKRRKIQDQLEFKLDDWAAELDDMINNQVQGLLQADNKGLDASAHQVVADLRQTNMEIREIN